MYLGSLVVAYASTDCVASRAVTRGKSQDSLREDRDLALHLLLSGVRERAFYPSAISVCISFLLVFFVLCTPCVPRARHLYHRLSSSPTALPHRICYGHT